MKRTAITQSRYSHRVAHQIPYHLPTMACADLDSEWSEYNHAGNGSRITSTTEVSRDLEHSLYSPQHRSISVQVESGQSIDDSLGKQGQGTHKPRITDSGDTTPYIQRELSRKIWVNYRGGNGR